MSSSSLYEFLAHSEERPSFVRPRHPLVVFCHLPFAILLAAAYVAFAEKTTGQTLYFLVTVGLYLSSTAYHAWRPDRFLRAFDQTMISWYVLVTPIPLIYHVPWALPVLAGMMILTALNKWYEWEPGFEVGSLVFLGLGVGCTFVAFGMGLPQIGASLTSPTSLWMMVAVACFIGKLAIYHFELRLVPNFWEAPESGHFILSVGVGIYSTIVILNPV